MAKSKEKRCARCGEIVKSYTYVQYCESCAKEVWDAGFESTTQHAEEIYEQQMEQMEK